MDSILDHNEFDDGQDDFESVPLPNQLPKDMSGQIASPTSHFSDVASHIETPSSMKSRTVQTLLSQNQDLMARLTVALKRNIELEQKVESQEDLYHSIANQYDILKDQAALNTEKNKHLEFENQRLFGQSSAIEKRFAELYSAYQDKVNYIQKLSYRLHRYLQYRKRIKGFVRPLVTQLKVEIVNLKNQILVLNEQGIKQLEFINDLKAKYSDAIDRIQTINNQNERTQMDLTQYHEVRYQGTARELESLKIEAASYKSQNADLKTQVETLSENEAALSNKAVFFERKYTDLKNEFEQVSQEFIQQKTSDNTRLTHLEIQLKDLSSQLAQVSNYKTELENENRQINDQLQSIQIIYQDNVTKIETLKKTNTALDQINKELSQSLLESRKKAEHLEEKFLLAEEDFKRKLQSFQVRFNKVPQEFTVAQATEQTKAGQKDLLNKIQTLLSEIQTGHSNGNGQISNIEFDETIEPKNQNNSSELISEFGDIEN
jgi:chromosome segregation ATPase